MKIQLSSQSGSIRFGFLLLALTVGALWQGGQGLYTAAMNRHPTVLSYEGYVKNKPKANWLTLTNCVLDLTRCCYKSYYGGPPTELFIPVRGTVAPNTKEPACVLLATTDPAHLAAFNEMRAATAKPNFEDWAIKNQNRVFCRCAVCGLVRYGIDLKSTERSELSHLINDSSDDFIILSDGARPSLGAGVGYSVAGMMLASGFVLYIRRNRTMTADQV